MLQPWKNPNRSKYVFPWRCSCLLLHLPRKRDLLLWICCVTDERTWQIERCHVQGKESNRIFFQLPKKKLWQRLLKGMNVKIFYPSSRKKRHFKMRASAKNLAHLVFYWTCASYLVTPREKFLNCLIISSQISNLLWNANDTFLVIFAHCATAWHRANAVISDFHLKQMW